MRYPDFTEEKKLWKEGYKIVAGLDEAGRGPLAGPVVAAAVSMTNQKFTLFTLLNATKLKQGRDRVSTGFKGIKDSKQLTQKQREKFYKVLINDKNIEWGIGKVSEKIIDEINILEATKLAMLRAIKNLESRQRRGSPEAARIKNKGSEIDFLLIDGNFGLDISLPQRSIIKGDQKVISISAASIIAKVSRDRIMEKFHKKYPQYGFARHKGYPTKLHVKMLKKFGPCPIHRKSFYPVRDLR